VDPVREGSRLISTVQEEGFLVFFGLGGGFAVTAALEREDIQQILVIDYGIDDLAALFASKSYLPLLQDPRLHIMADPSPAQVEAYILDQYQPVLYRGIRVIPLRPRIDGEPTPFSAATAAITSALTRVAGDYSVQAHLGARWFSNILRNLPVAEALEGPLPAITQAAISAAGPSLDLQLPLLAKRRNERFLIATDTSLPALLQAGLEPDAVISIDCQHISYYHFMQGLPRRIPLYLDLASPPVVASRTVDPRFFSSGHPLVQYVSQYWRPLPPVDTSGGNVTYAALSLAELLGAEEVELYGADFSYPLGRGYARGTYIHSLFDAQQTRFSPLEALWSAFLFRNPALKRIQQEHSWYYETPILSRYRQGLEAKTASLRPRVIPVQGIGAPLTLRKKRKPIPPRRFFTPVPPKVSAREFIAAYREHIRRLPPLQGTVQGYLQGLTPGERRILSTLLPLAAAIQRRQPSLGAAELIETLRTNALHALEKRPGNADT
jgi:hypothetical protein